MYSLKLKSTVTTVLFAILAFSFSTPAQACSLKSDETIVFFNTYGQVKTSENGEKLITLPVHGWIFEKKEKSLWRSIARRQFARISNFPTAGPEYANFIERGHYFFADNQRKKSLTIQIGDKLFNLPPSRKDGHFFAEITIPESELGILSKTNWLTYGIHEGHPNSSKFKGQCNVISEQGISVISDIDDTIKLSNVLDEKEKLKNAFLRPFKATGGTSNAYRKWESSGAVFHYVSGSPWQLYPFLKNGVRNSGFPEGSFHMREKDMSISSFIKNDEYNGLEHKVDVIRNLIKTYPKRKFVLVGDCTEQDPEVYAKIYSEFPEQILHIFVRKVAKANMCDERFQETFNGVPATMWDIFSDESTHLWDFSIGN